MAQQVIEGTGVILAGSFPRRRDGGTHPLPTPGASGSRRSRQSWESAGAWVKARLAFLVVRTELQEGFVAAVHVQAVGWSPSLHSASPSVLLAPLRCALAQTKPNCLYLFVGSDDAGGGLSKPMKKSFLVHALKKMGAAAAGRTGQDLSVHVNKVFHPNALARWQRCLCGKQRTKKLRVMHSKERLTVIVKIRAQRWLVSVLIAA